MNCIEHLRCISKGMAVFLTLSSKEQEEYNTYEKVLAIAEDPDEINARKKLVKKEIDACNNFYRLSFEDLPESAIFWIKGNRALEGHGEPININKAFKNYTEAAEQGWAQAYCSLGKMYEEGLEFKENKKTAYRKYQEGAEKGDANCLFNIGRMLEEEAAANYLVNEKVDLTEIAKYYKAAADKGCAAAKVKLGNWIEKGIYSDESIKDPVSYYKEAAKVNDGLAFNQLGINYYKQGEYKSALENFRLSKNLHCVNSLNNLGLCYENGTGVIKDKNTAIEYYEEAAKRRYIPAMLNLAYLMAFYGKYQEASMWYRQALIENARTTEAYLGLAELYLAGKGVEQNFDLAFKNFKKAGDYGSGEGYKRCGDLIITKSHLEKTNMEKAMRYYKKAAKLRNNEAMIALGEIYEKGNEHIEPDIGKAVNYYDKAYSNGSIHAGIIKARLLLERKTKVDREKANEIVSEIIRNNPNDEGLKTYIETTGVLALLKHNS